MGIRNDNPFVYAEHCDEVWGSITSVWPGSRSSKASTL